MEKAYLILSDGTVCEGVAAGKKGTVIGEFAFSTAVTGYLETLTNPEFSGKIVVEMFPLIGNYGEIGAETGGKAPAVSGYVVRELCQKPNNFRTEGTLGGYLEKNNIIGIEGIDTRALRRKHVLYGMISPDKNDLEEKLKQIRAFGGKRR